MKMSLNLDFRDAITRESLPSDNTYSIVQLAHEHRERYLYHTQAGDIILRRMPLRLQRVLQASTIAVSSKTKDMFDRLEAILSASKNIPMESLSDDVKREIYDIADTVAWTKKDYLGVIEQPALGCPDDFEDLVARLTRDERDVLYALITDLATPHEYNEVDPTEDVISQKYAGVSVFDDSCVGLMTVGQSAYWSRRIKEEQDAIRRQMNGN